MSSIDPEILNELEQERNYARSGGSTTARLKLENECGALIRFLPVKLGSNKSWFGRVGLHWVGKRPVNCPRTTSPALGGSPDAHCPVCALVEKLSQSRTREAQTIGNKANSWPQWLTYVLVFELIDADNRATPAKKHEMWTPHEFWMPRTSWLELSATYKRKFERDGIDIVDPVNGYDILVTKSKRGDLKFELDKQGPIVDKEGAELQEFVDKLCSFKPIDTHPASEQKLEEVALKLEDLAYGNASRSHDTGRGRAGGFNANESDDVPRRGSAREEPERREERRPATRAALDEDVPYPPEKQAVRREASSDVPARRVVEELPQRVAEAPVRRVESAPARRAEVAPPPARRSTLPPEDNDDGPENVPPETRDPAPPVDDITAEATAPESDEPPPDFPPGTPVNTPPRGRLSDKMQDSMRRIATRSTRTA